MKKKNVLLSIFVLSCSLFFSGCGKKEEKKEDIPLLPPVETVIEVEPVLLRDLYEVTSKDAEYSPYQTELYFLENGTIEDMRVKLGDSVKAGEVLAVQSEAQFQNAANKIQQTYQKQQEEHEAALGEIDRKLSQNPGIDQKEWLQLMRRQEIENYELKEPLLKESLQKAQEKLGRNQIIAPYDGVVSACRITGEFAGAGQAVIALANMEACNIMTYGVVTPSEMEKYSEVYAIVNGEKKQISYRDDLYVEGVDRAFFRLEEEAQVQPGDYVKVVFIGEVHPQVLSIPIGAVYEDKNGYFVYRLVDGKRMKQQIVTGYRNEVFVEITEGLTEGERVYVKN